MIAIYKVENENINGKKRFLFLTTEPTKDDPHTIHKHTHAHTQTDKQRNNIGRRLFVWLVSFILKYFFFEKLENKISL